MANITVRISNQLRTKMRSLSDINWSEVVRRAIEERIALEMARTRKNQKTTYDAAYLSLALLNDARFVTADRELHDRLSDSLKQCVLLLSTMK